MLSGEIGGSVQSRRHLQSTRPLVQNARSPPIVLLRITQSGLRCRKAYMEDSELREIGSWLPSSVEEWAFNTIGGLANATGRDLIGCRITTEAVQTTNEPRTLILWTTTLRFPKKILPLGLR